MKVVLVRHLAPLIEPGICYGRMDIPSDPAVADQARTLAMDPALAGVDCVYSSPALRCRSLAAEIALGSAVIADARLWELDFGAWEGKPWDAIGRADLNRWAAAPLTFAPPGGETGQALIGRIREFHADLARRRQDCIVVSHGGPLKVLAALLVGAPVDLLAPAPGLGSINVVTWRTCTIR